MLHKPLERRDPHVNVGLAAIAEPGNNLVENVIMIPADKMRLRQRHEEVDDAFGDRPAVDVITGEHELTIFVDLIDSAHEPFERGKHSVDVADDPAHKSNAVVRMRLD